MGGGVRELSGPSFYRGSTGRAPRRTGRAGREGRGGPRDAVHSSGHFSFIRNCSFFPPLIPSRLDRNFWSMFVLCLTLFVCGSVPEQ